MNGWQTYTAWCEIAFLLNLTSALVYDQNTDMRVKVDILIRFWYIKIYIHTGHLYIIYLSIYLGDLFNCPFSVGTYINQSTIY